MKFLQELMGKYLEELQEESLDTCLEARTNLSRNARGISVGLSREILGVGHGASNILSYSLRDHSSVIPGTIPGECLEDIFVEIFQEESLEKSLKIKIQGQKFRSTPENPGGILEEIPGRIPVKILLEGSIKELLETFLQELLKVILEPYQKCSKMSHGEISCKSPGRITEETPIEI